MNNTWNMVYLVADFALFAADHPGYGIVFGDDGEVKVVDLGYKTYVSFSNMDKFRRYLTDYAKDAYSVKRK